MEIKLNRFWISNATILFGFGNLIYIYISDGTDFLGDIRENSMFIGFGYQTELNSGFGYFFYLFLIIEKLNSMILVIRQNLQVLDHRWISFFFISD